MMKKLLFSSLSIFVLVNATLARAEKNIELDILFNIPEEPIPVDSTTIPVAADTTIIIPSSDVPKGIPDNTPSGITSILTGPDIILTDVNLIFDSLPHTCIPDTHIELTSPAGTTVTIIKALIEGGILDAFGCPDGFQNTVLDDQASLNLLGGVPPFIGSFNVEHPSVITNPLSVFIGENASGTWTLFVSDLADLDVGTLEAWSIEFTGASVAQLSISPPTGDYVTTQGFDLTLIIEASGLSVVGASATLDGSDVTGALVSCVIPGTLISGGQTFRCPGLTGEIFGAGTHTFDVILDLSDGSSVSDTVTWEVKGNME